MNKTAFLFCSLLFLATACAPQAELVKTRSEISDLREEMRSFQARFDQLQKRDDDLGRRIDAADTNIKGSLDVQNVMADYGSKTDQLSTDIQLLQGKLEENNFRLADLAHKLDDKTFKITELSARIDELESRVKALSAAQPLASAGAGTAEKAPEKASAPKSLEPSEAYRQAMNDYNSGNFDLALAGFQNYLVQFPDASQADKAQYWAGECFYAKKDFQKAIDAFLKVIKKYPTSDKAPGAKLKIGYSYINMNNHTKAKEWLQRVVKEYPETREADLAKEKLHKMAK